MDSSNSLSVLSSKNESTTDVQNSTTIPSELCTLIKSVKNDAFLTTWEQVMDGLRDYIWEKRLFDPLKMKVLCKGDALEGILGVHEFTILDIKKLLQGFVFRHSTDSPAEDIPTIPFCETTTKRKAEDHVQEISVKRERKCEHVGCLENCIYERSPMLLHIPPSPTTLESASDCDSLHNVETSYAKDSSDDSIYFETDSNGGHFLPSGSILTIAETFEVEFEPNSDGVSETEDSAFTDSDSDSDCDLDSIITFVCKTDSDQEFWADNSSDEDFGFDAEISEFDLWMCTRCKSKNQPLSRFCLKCFQTRNGWLPEKREFSERIHVKRKPRTKRKKRIKDSSKSLEDSSNAHTLSLDMPSTSKEKSASFEDFDFDKNIIQSFLKKSDTQNLKPNLDEKLCLLCCEKVIDSSIIHGKYGHSIACYRCAKRLQLSNKRCPICRRTIEKVVYQIS